MVGSELLTVAAPWLPEMEVAAALGSSVDAPVVPVVPRAWRCYDGAQRDSAEAMGAMTSSRACWNGVDAWPERGERRRALVEDGSVGWLR